MFDTEANQSETTTPLAGGVACHACGYNLEGLFPDGLCPECATPVRESTGGGTLGPPWLSASVAEQLASGARLTSPWVWILPLTPVTLGAVAFMLPMFGEGLLVRGGGAESLVMSGVLPLCLLAVLIPSLAVLGAYYRGWQRLTGPVLAPLAGQFDLARLIRVVLPIEAITIVVWFLLLVVISLVAHFSNTGPGGVLALLLWSVSFLAAIGGVTLVFVQSMFISRLAGVLPASGCETLARVSAVATGVTLGACVLGEVGGFPLLYALGVFSGVTAYVSFCAMHSRFDVAMTRIASVRTAAEALHQPEDDAL